MASDVTSDIDVLRGAPTNLYVGGEFRPASGGRRLPVYDPATGAVLAYVADAGLHDAEAAVAFAAAAADGWASTSPRERADLLYAVSQAMSTHADRLATIVSLEMGKPLAEALGEVRYATDFVRFYAEEAVRVGGRHAIAPRGDGEILTRSEPIGPCLLITPWNFPLAMVARKVAPALAAGCTAVVKPAEQTPLSALSLAELFMHAGIDAGVLNIVTTSRPAEVVEPLLSGGVIRKLSFTGSTPVGQRLLAACAPRLVRTSMELGGNAAFIVFEDADLDAAVKGALAAKLRNGGEACTAANRFLVHETVAEPFVERLAAAMEDVKVGPGTRPGTGMGPIIDERQRERIVGLFANAVESGGRPTRAEVSVDADGHFMRPALVVDPAAEARIWHEEIFGPIAAVGRFLDESEAVTRANATAYGLAAYVYTRDLERALRVSARLRCGMVGINRGVISDAAAPFGGVGDSGFGREGGAEGIAEYLSVKYVALPPALT